MLLCKSAKVAVITPYSNLEFDNDDTCEAEDTKMVEICYKIFFAHMTPKYNL